MRSPLVHAAACCATLLGLLPAPVAAQGATPSAPAVGAEAPSLPVLVDRAWRLAREDDAQRARRDEAGARELAAGSAFAGSPSVSLDVRRDLPRGLGLPGTDAVSDRGKVHGWHLDSAGGLDRCCPDA
ncbi:MAG: hypothetical protein WCK28_15120, partial [Burkholderiales bacterium]